MKSIFVKIFKTLRKSFLTCLFTGTLLMIINKFMGINISGLYYLMLGSICFVLLSIGLILENSQYVFSKTKKVKKRTVSDKNKKTIKDTNKDTKSIKRKVKKREIS